MTVDPDGLTGDGFALSLTVGRTPDTRQEWSGILDLYFRRLRRLGAIRGHWVVEWQARGAPHVHMSVYFQAMDRATWCAVHNALGQAWLDLTRHLGTQPRGQHVVPIENAQFWGAYMAKHAGRGKDHYQREQGLLPESWTNSGRMWGKFGDWPTREEAFDCDPTTFYRWRRWVRRWQLARIRTELVKAKRYGNRRQLATALRLLALQRKAGPGKTRSRVLGVGTFCPEDVSRRLLDLAMDHPEGFVTSRSE